MSDGHTQIVNRLAILAKTFGAAWRFAHDMSSGHAPRARDLRDLGVDGSNLQFAASPRFPAKAVPQRSDTRRAPVAVQRGINSVALAS